MNKISRAIAWHFENMECFSNKNSKVQLTDTVCDLIVNNVKIASKLLDGTRVVYIDNIKNYHSNALFIHRLETIPGIEISKVKQGFKINKKVYTKGNIIL